jgi:hypothetical protein
MKVLESPAAASTPVLLRLLALLTVFYSFFVFDNNNSVGGGYFDGREAGGTNVTDAEAKAKAAAEKVRKCETLYDTMRFPYSDPRPIDCHVVGESVG